MSCSAQLCESQYVSNLLLIISRSNKWHVDTRRPWKYLCYTYCKAVDMWGSIIAIGWAIWVIVVLKSNTWVSHLWSRGHMFHSQELEYLLWALIHYIHRLPCLIYSDYHQKNLFVKDRVWVRCWGCNGLMIN